MNSTKYHCTNFAACDRALGKQVVEVAEGEEPDCENAGCRKYLIPVKEGATSKGLARKVGLIAACVAVLGGTVFFIFPSSPNPEAANAALTEYFPELPQ